MPSAGDVGGFAFGDWASYGRVPAVPKTSHLRLAVSPFKRQGVGPPVILSVSGPPSRKMDR